MSAHLSACCTGPRWLIDGKCSTWRVQVLWGDSGDIKAAVHHLLWFSSDCWTSGTLDQTAPAWNLISSSQIKIRATLFGLTLECTLNTFRNATSFFVWGYCFGCTTPECHFSLLIFKSCGRNVLLARGGEEEPGRAGQEGNNCHLT